QSRARPGGQEPKVIADLGQLDRDALENRGNLYERTGILRRLDEVRGRDQVQPGDGSESLPHGIRVTGVGVDPRPDRRRPEVDLTEERLRLAETKDVLFDGDGER